MMHVKIKETCPLCSGSGKNGISNAQASDMAYEHNDAARSMAGYSNYMISAEFQECSKCTGTGKIKRWASIDEIMLLLR